jgi:hypothetical protein
VPVGEPVAPKRFTDIELDFVLHAPLNPFQAR